MLDPGKNYMTRDGFPVRIVATDAKGRFPVVGLVDMDDAEYTRQWTSEGKSDLRDYVRTNYDLVEAGKEASHA